MSETDTQTGTDMAHADRYAAYELIAEVAEGGRYVRARDAAMDLLGRYVSPDGLRDIVYAGNAHRSATAVQRWNEAQGNR